MDVGTWARAGNMVGIVSKVDDDGVVTLFNPGDRQILKATQGALTELPTGIVEAQVAVRLVVPHGLTDSSVRRWLATLVDPVLRERAQESLRELGLDGAPMTIEPTIEVREVADG